MSRNAAEEFQAVISGYTVDFTSWITREELGEAFFRAFKENYRGLSAKNVKASKSRFDTFLRFLEWKDPKRSIRAINNLSTDLYLEYGAFLKASTLNHETANRYWNTVTRLTRYAVQEAISLGANFAVFEVPYFRQPEEMFARIENKSHDLVVWKTSFNGGKKSFDFSSLGGRPGIAATVTAFFREKIVNLRESSCQYYYTKMLVLNRFLNEYDPAKEIKIISDIDHKTLAALIEHLDESSTDSEYCMKTWKVICDCLKSSSDFKLSARLPGHPWAGVEQATGVKTPSLTVGEIAAFLRAAMKDIEEIRAVYVSPSALNRGPKMSELLPFVIGLSILTLFNPSVVAEIKLPEIGKLPDGRMRLVGEKYRSGGDVSGTFIDDSEVVSPQSLIELLTKITLNLRPMAHAEVRDYLFIGVTNRATTQRHIQAFTKLSPTTLFHFNWAFSKRHGLRRFNFRYFRVSGANVITAITGGNVKAVQAVLNHRSSSSTEEYTRVGLQASGEKQLADQQEKRIRFVRTGGARDIRDQSDGAQQAATPGFSCADAFNPPEYLDQEPGMCAAYGGCPDCPLAGVDFTSPVAFAHILRLRNQIIEAHQAHRFSPDRWIRIWKPRLRAIEEIWLPRFGPDVVDEASRLPNLYHPALPEDLDG